MMGSVRFFVWEAALSWLAATAHHQIIDLIITAEFSPAILEGPLITILSLRATLQLSICPPIAVDR